MAAGDRSRSPRERCGDERISRAIAGFGRYPGKRPQGLRVDAAGAMSLENLMDVWGYRQGLKDQEVLDAVRLHMIQREGGGGGASLRFGITSDEDGGIIIRVLPKQEGRGGDFVLRDDGLRAVPRRRRPQRREDDRRCLAWQGGGHAASASSTGGSAARQRTGGAVEVARLDFSAYPRCTAAASPASLAYSLGNLPREDGGPGAGARAAPPGPPPVGSSGGFLASEAQPMTGISVETCASAAMGAGFPSEAASPPLPMSAREPAAAPRLGIDQKLDLPLEVLIIKDEDMAGGVTPAASPRRARGYAA